MRLRRVASTPELSVAPFGPVRRNGLEPWGEDPCHPRLRDEIARVPRSLLSDAEAAEDAVQQVFGIDRAGHLAQLAQGDADLGGDQFLAEARPHGLAGAVERRGGQSQRLAATHGRAHHHVGPRTGRLQTPPRESPL